MRYAAFRPRRLASAALAALVLWTAVAAPPWVARAGKPPAHQAEKKPTGPASVILMIGDGMGPEQVKLGRITKGKPLCFEAFPHTATCTTSTLTGTVTDSAAAGTAIATGHKTLSGRVSVDAEGEPLETILEQFQARGARTGLVTTCDVVDATPAVFAAHAENRGMYFAIAAQMLTATRPDVVMGGGWFCIGPIVAAMEKQGDPRANDYRVVRTRQELAAADPKTTRRLLGIFADGALTFEASRPADWPEPTLAEMTRAALDVLSPGQEGKRTFFLMVEGGRIDHACHANDATGAAGETVAFDRAVQAAIDWVDKRKAWDRTLLLVTADHECGGLQVLSDHKDPDGYPDDVEWSTGYHTDTPVPAYARGVGADRIKGQMDNTDLFKVIQRCLPGPSGAAKDPKGDRGDKAKKAAP
jgi:alkaline phosphatase